MSKNTRPRPLIFHGGEHLWTDTLSGEIARRISIVEDVPVRVHVGSAQDGRYLTKT